MADELVKVHISEDNFIIKCKKCGSGNIVIRTHFSGGGWFSAPKPEVYIICKKCGNAEVIKGRYT